MKTQLQQTKQESRTLQSKTKAANQAPMSQILQTYSVENGKLKSENVQLKEDSLSTFNSQLSIDEDEDELLQGKFDSIKNVQLKEDSLSTFNSQLSIKNNTGLPDNLKTGIENLSGYSMDDVQVHYNSPKPAQLQALAYTQGTDIHVAPGQEKHLPHEAWHVVQQKQGRVQPTMQLQGVNINDNKGLEKEADVMGNKSFTTIQRMTPMSQVLNASLVQMQPKQTQQSQQISQTPPQSYFLIQPHTGPEAAYCGYYALANYLGLDPGLPEIEKIAYQNYATIGISQNEIPQFISKNGLGIEIILTATYRFVETSDVTQGILNGRFMAATNRHGGHWITYIRDTSGNWWEYDSWENGATFVGAEPTLIGQLKKDSCTKVYYK